jgi:hypothetical protein
MNSNLGEGGMDIFADALDEFLPPPSPISPSSSSSSSSYGGADAEGGRTGMQRAIAAYFAAFPVSVVRRAMNLTSIRRGGIRILAIGDLAEEYLSAFPNSTVEEVAALIETALTHIKNQNRRRTAAALEEECTAVVEPEPKKRRRGKARKDKARKGPVRKFKGENTATFKIALFVCHLVEDRVGPTRYRTFLAELGKLKDKAIMPENITAVLSTIDDILKGHPDLVVAIEGLLPPHHPRYRYLGAT